MLCNIQLQGPQPTVVGQVTTGDGCGHGGLPCDNPNVAKHLLMKNCGSYNVYYLKPVAYCNARYCVS